jgi:hypothetical protein
LKAQRDDGLEAQAEDRLESWPETQQPVESKVEFRRAEQEG